MHGLIAQAGAAYQSTVAAVGSLTGVGVHSGISTTITLKPAKANEGVVFQRVDLPGRPKIPAHAQHVVANELCTVIGLSPAISVSTIEHLMAALRAAEIDNVLVEIDGPEMPIMDGASASFMSLLDRLGQHLLPVARTAFRVLKPVMVTRGDAVAEFLPFDGMRYDVTIDFPSAFIGRQSLCFDLTSGYFRREVARARTFGLMVEFERAKAAGFCKGSSLANSVGVGETEVHAEGGLRWSDEFVRHKSLDAVGDLALAGGPFIGHFRSYKGGHRLNVELVKALLADESAFERVEKDLPSYIAVQDVRVAVSA